MTWAPAKVLCAWGDEAINRAGYAYRDLGIYKFSDGSPKGRRPPRWCLIHLNSGHAIGWISGTVATAFPIATEIAECTDWSFDGRSGWRNLDPDLPTKIAALRERHPKILDIRGGGGSDAAAQAVLAGRAA